MEKSCDLFRLAKITEGWFPLFFPRNLQPRLVAFHCSLSLTPYDFSFQRRDFARSFWSHAASVCSRAVLCRRCFVYKFVKGKCHRINTCVKRRTFCYNRRLCRSSERDTHFHFFFSNWETTGLCFPLKNLKLLIWSISGFVSNLEATTNPLPFPLCCNQTIRNVRICGGETIGVLFLDLSRGLLEAAQISAHPYPLLTVRDGAGPSVHRCQIFGGKQSAVLLQGGGNFTVAGTNNSGSSDEIGRYESPNAQRKRLQNEDCLSPLKTATIEGESPLVSPEISNLSKRRGRTAGGRFTDNAIFENVRNIISLG